MDNEKEDLNTWFYERIKEANFMDESNYDTNLELLKHYQTHETRMKLVRKMVFQENKNPTDENLKIGLEDYYNQCKKTTSEERNLALTVALYELKKEKPEKFDHFRSLSF